MCGIFGIISKKDPYITPERLKESSNLLFKLSESRGKEASGVTVATNGKAHIFKLPVKGSELIKRKRYDNLFSKDMLKASQNSLKNYIVIGHSRLATHGYQEYNFNNQPVVKKGTICVHNGIITNEKYIWRKIIKKEPKYEVDTEALVDLVNLYLNEKSLQEAIKDTYNTIEGSASIAMLFQHLPKIVLSTNTGSLYIAKSEKPRLVAFASERYILKEFVKKSPILFHKSVKVKNIRAGTGQIVDLNKILSTEEFTVNGMTKKETGLVRREEKNGELFEIEKLFVDDRKFYHKKKELNPLSKTKKHGFDYHKIYSIPRCTKCILPSTMPNITFDVNGVCNYCKNHKKIEYKGKDALEKLVSSCRSKNGEPDCILAFSGGRDSSYGLHFLKKELGLNPIAYTYDWGMVTDMARRNEARMVGKLGVEHVIVSADIPKKLKHIRKHILAWIKKPDLGMVPLFMEGDKQCEFYAWRLMKKTGIKLMFYCRGNRLENEDFKHTHVGIKNCPTPDGVIHHLPVSGKIRIALYYARQYLTNPAYINSSIFDTMFAYFSTYIMRYNFVFLWHYIPWREDVIIPTLRDKYGWETEEGTNATWRTDDGTAAFYNYIYYQVQGFTENDNFRSSQIREGLLEREKALKIVHQENKPRYKALKWYFDRVGIDGDMVLSVVDRMPKLY